MAKQRSPKPLVDIRFVRIDPSLPKQERLADYIRQVGDPYHYMDGDISVSLTFAQNGISLEDQMLSYLKRKI